MATKTMRHRTRRPELLTILGIVGVVTLAAVARRLRSGARSVPAEPVRLFELSEEIERPPEEVFEFVADFRNDVQWGQRFIEEVRQTSEGPLGVGTKFVVVGHSWGCGSRSPSR
jgi:hypothetical protein